ncbi:MAG: M24 family metallopeptidase, partial [Planctomycetota bacterium]
KAVIVAEESFKAILARFDRNWTEQQLAWELEREMRSRGASGVSFPIIAASGPASALPHYHPGPNRISDSPVLLIDWGAKLDGYVSDLTRMLWLDEDGPSAEFEAAHTAVNAAVEAAISVIRPGQSVRVVDQAARKELRAAGMEEAFLHSLGHGIGLEVHEGPRISSAGDDDSSPVLREGMIVTIEPGVYFADQFGIRLEEDVLVTESGSKPLSTLPRGLVDLQAMM